MLHIIYGGLFSEVIFVVINKGIEQVFTGYQKIVALPLKSINILVCYLCVVHPVFACSFTNNSHFAIEHSDATFQGNRLTIDCSITADKVGSFAASNLQPSIIQIILPCLSVSCRKHNRSEERRGGKEG